MGGLGVVLGWSGGAGGRPGALSCSVALVFFKNNASHAAWRSFWAAGVPPGALPCSVALVFCKNNASHAAWRSFWAATTHKQSNKQSINQTNNLVGIQHLLYFFRKC